MLLVFSTEISSVRIPLRMKGTHHFSSDSMNSAYFTMMEYDTVKIVSHPKKSGTRKKETIRHSSRVMVS